jgi:hypothetical protein
MSGSFALVTGVGTAIITKSACLILEGSVVASILLPGVVFSLSMAFWFLRYPIVFHWSSVKEKPCNDSVNFDYIGPTFRCCGDKILWITVAGLTPDLDEG